MGGRAAARGAPGKRDAELEAGTEAHYEDPAYYTKTYQNRLEDVRYYAEVALESDGPVLEYGAGNGRITIPIARLGVSITGVDRSKAMLDDLRARLGDEPEDVRARVHVKRGDMRTAKLNQRFSRVFCPFNAFLHLYTRRDVERFLARSREHLAPGGELVFDISMPEPEELARHPSRAYHAPRFRYPDKDGKKGTLVKYTERFDYDKCRQILFVAMEFHPTNGEPGWMTPLAHRQFYPQELDALLHYNGFRVTESYGDFFRSRLTSNARTMVLHARPRRR